MAEQGRLVQWNDERGFGFIEASSGKRHFVHISAIARSAARPRIGDEVRFEPSLGADGRPQARAVRIIDADPPPVTPRSARGLDWRVPVALILLSGLLAGLVLANLPQNLVLIYLAMGVVSFIAYGSDKYYAEAGQWRTREKTLLGFDLCFGIVGGLLGQSIFRHKTRKPGYVASTVVIALAHLAWIVALASGALDAKQVFAQGLRWLGMSG